MSATNMAESTSSTLSPTEEEGDKQGTHELELHYGGELDLHQHVVCDKNPGHIDFIPVNSFNVEKLYKTSMVDHFDLALFCSEAAKLTTKIKVYRVSSNRSKEKMKKIYNIDHYPLSAYAGKKKLGVGSGCVTDIDVSGDQGSFPCPLENCPHSTEPHQVYGYIVITTAAHVVFDDDEAKDTIVEFFDDDPKDKKNVEIVHGVKVKHCSVEGDFCEFMCVTHSQSLFGEISRLCLLSLPSEFEYKWWNNQLVVRIFRLFKLIKMFQTQPQGSSNLQVILDSDQHTRRCSYGVFDSTTDKHNQVLLMWQHYKYDEAQLLIAEDFLKAAESVSGVAGLRASVQRFLNDRSAISHEEFSKEFFTEGIETTVKRIALIGTLSLIYINETFLDTENIFIFFIDILYGVENISTSIDFLIDIHFENMLSEVKIITFKNYSRLMRGWFRTIHNLLDLSAVNDKLSTMLKCQLIIKLSSQVRGSVFEMIKNLLLRMSDSIDQVSSTLSLYFRFEDDYNKVPLSVSHNMSNSAFPEGRCRHLTQLWRANTLIPEDQDPLIAMLEDLYQKSSDLIMKVNNIDKTILTSYNFIPPFSVENIRQCLVDTENVCRRSSLFECGVQCEQAFINEVKDIIDVPRDVLQQQTNNSLLIHISHPHGQSKQVSIGEHFSCNTGTGYYEHIYTVPTCNGCSGGPVWILPKTENGKILWDKVEAVPHGGCYDRGNKLNHSSSWTFSPFSKWHRPQYNRWEVNERDSIVPQPMSFLGRLGLGVNYSAAKASKLQKEWLWYLLESTDIRLLSGMTVKDAINRKKSLGAGKRISKDVDVECLLSLACQYEWP